MRTAEVRRDTQSVLDGHEIADKAAHRDLLTVLAEQHGIVLSRDYLYEHIWGYHVETSSKSLDVYVGYLRRKLEEDGEPRLLHTVRGVGYVLREQG